MVTPHKQHASSSLLLSWETCKTHARPSVTRCTYAWGAYVFSQLVLVLLLLLLDLSPPLPVGPAVASVRIASL